ncbi:hypothetical protein SEA_NEDARYA_82 [Gordonia phage Nedarya]|nr:hypothetical protein SEA_NEDARYA_82 [Gordonia phage Nedarya]
MPEAAVRYVNQVSIYAHTKHGEILEGTAGINELEGYAQLHTPKVKGWRSAHRGWITQFHPNAELTLELKTVNYFDGVETVTTRWRF